MYAHYFKTYFIASLCLIMSTPIIAASDLPEDLNKLVQLCAGCHGADGNSTNVLYPSFGGISSDYFRYTIKAYKKGIRVSSMMKMFVEDLSDQDVDKLAEYYAKQSFKPSVQEHDKELAQKGAIIHAKYCIKCHGINGSVDKYNYGILAGQWMSYLQLTIKEYLEGKRKVNPMMVTKLKRVQNEVGDQGFEQLVHFYASVK